MKLSGENCRIPYGNSKYVMSVFTASRRPEACRWPSDPGRSALARPPARPRFEPRPEQLGGPSDEIIDRVRDDLASAPDPLLSRAGVEGRPAERRDDPVVAADSAARIGSPRFISGEFVGACSEGRRGDDRGCAPPTAPRRSTGRSMGPIARTRDHRSGRRADPGLATRRPPAQDNDLRSECPGTRIGRPGSPIAPAFPDANAGGNMRDGPALARGIAPVSRLSSTRVGRGEGAAGGRACRRTVRSTPTTAARSRPRAEARVPRGSFHGR